LSTRRRTEDASAFIKVDVEIQAERNEHNATGSERV